MHALTDRQTIYRLGKKLTYFFFNNTSVIMLQNIHFNISVYGQDASTDRTFLHSKTSKSFLLQTILLFHWLTES